MLHQPKLIFSKILHVTSSSLSKSPESQEETILIRMLALNLIDAGSNLI